MSATSQQTIRSKAAEIERSLAAGPHPDRARPDAAWLLLLALRREFPDANRAWLIAHQDDTLSPDCAAALDRLAARRTAGEPMQHISGEAEFFGLPFSVNSSVLIPRPETEHLVEKVLALARGISAPKIVDVGTGSGAIAISLAHELANAQICATDLSTAALAIAIENAERDDVADRIRFLAGDLLAPVANERFDLVASNPPYVPERDRASLSVEVRDYEPAQALFAGEDGLAIYWRLIPAAFAALVPGGFIAFEIGYGQSDALRALLEQAGFNEIEFVPDLQGIPRVVTAKRP
jgi:release factor glutamine methyltransferase